MIRCRALAGPLLGLAAVCSLASCAVTDTTQFYTLGAATRAGKELRPAAAAAASVEPLAGAATTGNAHDAQDVAVPPTLQQALHAFRSSALAEDAFGAEVVAHYAHLAQLEIDHHHGLVTDAERQRWLARA